MWFKLTGDERLKECDTEGCHQQQSWRLEAGGMGSNYCSACKDEIDQWVEKNVNSDPSEVTVRKQRDEWPDYQT